MLIAIFTAPIVLVWSVILGYLGLRQAAATPVVYAVVLVADIVGFTPMSSDRHRQRPDGAPLRSERCDED